MIRIGQHDIDTVIFDMDGLLIDSEPYWKIAEKQVFGQYGLKLTDELLRQVMGFRLSEVVAHWFHYQPWEHPDHKKTETEVLEEVKKLIIGNAEALPGVMEVIAFCQKNNLKMAVASSSAMSLIEAVMQKLGIADSFQLLWSAEYEPYGKPHPGIFLTVASRLGSDPRNCLVFEDSINGVIAAKAARMCCIAVPEPVSTDDKRFAIADLKLNRIDELLLLDLK